MNTNVASINSSSDDDQTADVGGVAGKRLLSFFDRIERLEEEKAAMRLRKMEVEKRREEDELLSLYMSAIGME